MEAQIITAVQQVLPKVLVAALLLLINYGLKYVPGVTQHLFGMGEHKVGTMKDIYVKGILYRFVTLAEQKVLMLENTEIQYIKTQAAAGMVTPAQLPTLLAGVKNKAIEAVKADASAQGLWATATSIFGGNEAALVKWLGDVIESNVAKLPPSGLQTTSLEEAKAGFVPAMSSAPMATPRATVATAAPAATVASVKASVTETQAAGS